ncbi:MAG: uracil-DNA glycosylase [Pseudomonadota bacterium]
MTQLATTDQPGPNCDLCPRLESFRNANRADYPDFFNAPVPSFLEANAGIGGPPLLIVGLAPGLRGANRTGRPFTGDYAGDLLYATLSEFGFSEGSYQAEPFDGLRLTGCRITNAVRCVPPQNAPTSAEVNTCRRYLIGEIAAMTNLKAIVALGGVAHKSVVASLGLRQAAYPFAHAAMHGLPSDLVLADSYHCSRYNTNTGRLTPDMFRAVFAQVRQHLDTVA